MGKTASTEKKSMSRDEVSWPFREHSKYRRLGQTAIAQLELIWAAALAHSREAVEALPFGLAGPGSSLPEMPAFLGQPWREALYGPKPEILYPYLHREFWR